jgi:hypothetical protein
MRAGSPVCAFAPRTPPRTRARARPLPLFALSLSFPPSPHRRIEDTEAFPSLTKLGARPTLRRPVVGALHLATRTARHARTQPRSPRKMSDAAEVANIDIYKWVDGIPLSRPKKNIARDFADGGTLCGHCAAANSRTLRLAQAAASCCGLVGPPRVLCDRTSRTVAGSSPAPRAPPRCVNRFVMSHRARRVRACTRSSRGRGRAAFLPQVGGNAQLQRVQRHGQQAVQLEAPQP